MKKLLSVLVLLGVVLSAGAGFCEDEKLVDLEFIPEYDDNSTKPGGIKVPLADMVMPGIPDGISLVGANGNFTSEVTLAAGEAMEFHVMYNPDAEEAFAPFPDNTISIRVIYGAEIETGDSIYVGSTAPDIGCDADPVSYVTVTALREVGNEGSAYEDRLSRFIWHITYSYDTWDIDPDGNGGINTHTSSRYTLSPVTVTVTNTSGGNTSSDGGGTCNAAGLGALSLLLSLAFIHKKN